MADAQQRRDPKFVTAENGVWYPRAGTLGGCTAHNAMILVAPSNKDWNHIADLTGLGMQFRTPAGDLSPAFVFTLSLADTAIVVGLVFLFVSNRS